MPGSRLGRMDDDKPVFCLSVCPLYVFKTTRKKQGISDRPFYRTCLGYFSHSLIAFCFKKNAMDAFAHKKSNNAFYFRCHPHGSNCVLWVKSHSSANKNIFN